MKEMVSLAEARPVTESWVADVSMYPAGERQSLVYAKSTGATCLMHATYGELLAQCREFKTLDEHLSAFCHRKQAGGKPLSAEVMQGLRARLQQLAREGYLISQSQVRGIFEEADEPALPTHITTIGLPTCNRVETAQRGLSSYLEHCQHFGRNPEFVVMDDSQSPSTREAYQEMLRGLKKRYGMSITYAGVEEKTAYVRKLSEVGQIPEEIVSWACLGDRTYSASTYGANLNILLLHTVGECILITDDDIVCRVAAAPDFKDGLALRDRDYVQYWYYPDRKSALEAAPAIEQDFLALHEQWLGQDPRVSGAPYSRANQISIELVDPAFLRHVATQPGKITLTMNGVIGDSSYIITDFLFFNPPESFKRLMSSEQVYHSARTSREVAQVANQLTLTTKPDNILCDRGMDNRELLPPHPPIGRDEDTAFGALFSTCFPNAYAVYLPWVSLHMPPEARSYAELTCDIPFDSWLYQCIARFSPKQISTPTAHLSQLGQFLESIGRLPMASFEEFTRHFLWQYEGGRISSLEHQLHKNGLLASWKRDAEIYSANVRQSMLLPVKQRMQGGAEIVQRSFVQFAQILHWWPVMVEAAKCLRADGIRVAQPV